MRIRLLRKELLLVFLFTKYNIVPSSTTIELYSRDAILINMILERCPFDIASVMYISILQHMGRLENVFNIQGRQNHS